jgi:O-succinylbenzoic acid--CoA ligase
MAGYANPERLPGDGLDNGWLSTTDIGYQSGNGALHVLGRADDVLMVGGEAVSPMSIENRMMAAPGVLGVVVVGFEDLVWGNRLVAAYEGDVPRTVLDAWCAANLPRRERPREIRRLTRLPILLSGKPDRTRIREMFTAAAGPFAVGAAESQG